jgi:MarR family 2-MHQ and catechol resistance regulon transcriptional repressor
VNAADLHRLARVLREIALTVTAIPGEESVSAGTMAIVEDVYRNASSAIGDIAERTGLAQSLVSKTVARLRERGLFTVGQDPRDGRRTLVSVTPGASVDVLLPQNSRVVDDGIRAMFPDMTPAQVNRILLGLNVLADEVLGGKSTGESLQRPAGRVAQA